MATALSLLDINVNKVIVHPLVLLSVVDHYNRINRETNEKRVVGILLGSFKSKGVLDISNSFGVPFDEDSQNNSVWFLDHDFLESMADMFKKICAKERIVGWYHTGPKLYQNDIIINELIQRYCPYCVLVIVDVTPKDIGLPTEVFIAIDYVQDDGSKINKTFEHVPSEIAAEEAEEIGVEHLLRDVKDTTVSSLAQNISEQLLSLKGLNGQLKIIKNYVKRVGEGTLPINHEISYQLQNILNLLPDISNEKFSEALHIRTNDQMLVVYLASLVRSVLALHNLINNKLANRETEEGKQRAKMDLLKQKSCTDKKEFKSKDTTNEKNTK